MRRIFGYHHTVLRQLQRRGIFVLLILTGILTLAASTAFGKPRKARHKAKTRTVQVDSFAHPDFAFPETVIGNATEALAKAGKAKEYDKCISALIQLTIANNSISDERMPQMAALLDSVANTVPEPYVQIIRSIEAQLYYQYWNADRGVYDGRLAQLNPDYTSSPDTWNGDMFRTRLRQLLAASLENSQELAKYPMRDFKSLLNGCSDLNLKYYPSLYLLLAYRAVDLYSSMGDGRTRIPFTEMNSQSGNGSGSAISTSTSASSVDADRILNDIIGMYSSEHAPLVIAVAREAQNLDGVDKINFLKKWLGNLRQTPESLYLLDIASGFPGVIGEQGLWKTRHEYYIACCDALKQYPASDFAPLLRNDVNGMENKSVDVSYATVSQAGSPLEVKVKSENVEKCTLLLICVDNLFNNIDPLGDNLWEVPAKRAATTGKVVSKADVEFNGEIPYNITASVVFKSVGAGRYIVLPSADGTVAGIYPKAVSGKYASVPVVRSGNISTLTMNPGNGESGRLYVVDSSTQAPVKGAKVTFYDPYPRGGKSVKGRGETNDDGWVAMPEGNIRALIEKRGDGYSESFVYSTYGYRGNRQGRSGSLAGTLFTDLAIYHPGDTLRYAVVGYLNSGDARESQLSIPAGLKAIVRLRNANNVLVAADTLAMDEFGRAQSLFALPRDGVTGSYSLEATINMPEGEDRIDGNVVNKGKVWQSVTVSDYKQPTFFVELDKPREGFKMGDRLDITGRAMTYSGMPVSGATVTIEIDYRSYRDWYSSWYGGQSAGFSATVTTDGEGRFYLPLGTEKLRDTRYSRGSYTVVATVASAAGESEASEPMYLYLGDNYSIAPSVPSIVEYNHKEKGLADFKVAVKDAAGNSVNKKVGYTVCAAEEKSNGKDDSSQKSKALLEGAFDSPSLKLDLSSLPSGKYDISFTLDGDTAVRSNSAFILYRKDNMNPPVQTPLWLPVTKVTAKGGSRKVTVDCGSSYKGSKILMAVTDGDKLLDSRWIDADGRNISVDIPAPENNGRVWAVFYGMHDFNGVSKTVEVLPAQADDKLTVSVESFRDKIIPGNKEKWRFRFARVPALKNKNGKGNEVAALAVLSDKALNSLVDFRWNFDPRAVTWRYNPLSISGLTVNERSNYINISSSQYTSFTMPQMPDINFYDQMLTGNRGMRYLGMLRKSGAKYLSAGAVVDEVMQVENEGVMNDAAPSVPQYKEMKSEATEEVADEGAGKTNSEGEFRPAQMPLAFFAPSLRSNPDGTLDMEFTVPDFNTTWQFQLVGYDRDLYSATLVKDALASKPVMVNITAPRFLRTGDDVVLTATLSNSTTENLRSTSMMEVFSPIDGKVLANVNVPVDIEAGASKVISLDFKVPDNAMMLGIRSRVSAMVKGEDGTSMNCSDGEQTLLSVLPATSPVFESLPFYMGDGNNKVQIKLPEYDSDATVTLNYCDSPVWYCLTALPSLMVPESDNVLSLSKAFYGNALAGSIVNKYPSARSAIASWIAEGENGPKSPLEENKELKTILLENTVWVSDAEAETLRIRRLGELLDAGRLNASVGEVALKIAKLQYDNGGWSWIGDMKPSLFVTEKVLEYIGMLVDLKAVSPDMKMTDEVGLRDAIDKGAKYCEEQIVSDYNRHPESYSYMALMQWMYIKSMLGYESDNATMKALCRRALSDISAKWRNMSIYDQAIAAIVLFRNGETRTPAMVLDSLRQRALSDPDKGMWYDNLSSGYEGRNTLATTTQVLRAYSEINPEAPQVDLLRQWLLLQKQTCDWGSADDAGVVYTLLSTGADWTDGSAPARFMLGDKILVPSKRDAVLGSFNLTLNAKEASGKLLTVEKNGTHPAWGGVAVSYIAPLDDIKAYSIPDLSIDKKVYLMQPDGSSFNLVDTNRLKVGDRVRIMLTIKSGRDMDYVAVTDERAGCMEPAEQLPGMQAQESVWYYREPRTSATNLFIGFLPKGTVVLTYDCYIMEEGTFVSGIATAQSQYSPLMTAHSAPEALTVSAR